MCYYGKHLKLQLKLINLLIKKKKQLAKLLISYKRYSPSFGISQLLSKFSSFALLWKNLNRLGNLTLQ